MRYFLILILILTSSCATLKDSEKGYADSELPSVEEFGLTEGVVVKGSRKSKGNDIVWMSKIKTLEWLNQIREKLGEKALIEEFNGKIDLLNI